MSEVLKSIMRLFPNGVAIITTNWNDKLVGMTVNTFNSLSLNPPLVMFSVDRIKGNDLPFKQSNAFAINLVDNKEILDVFAKKPAKERFNIVRYMEGIDGVPILTDSYAYIMAGKYNIIDIGDHS
ncbi:MAG: flavin reductase family protein, partial [Sulfolobus sp.]|nr:flavin reductase family protein [Sulfolobus sp.]